MAVITGTWGKPVYSTDDDSIKVAIDLDDPIEVLNLSDITIADVDIVDGYVTGGEEKWEVSITPAPETSGVMSLDITGNIYAQEPASLTDTSTIEMQVLLIPYSTIEPYIVASYFPPLSETGVQTVYLEFNTPVIDLTPQSFEIGGANIGAPLLYAADTPVSALHLGQRPLDTEYKEYRNSWQPRVYFRLDFQMPDPPPIGNMEIELKSGAARSFLDIDPDINFPIKRLDFTKDLPYSKSIKLALVTNEELSFASGDLPDGISALEIKNIIYITGTPTTVGTGTAIFTIGFFYDQTNAIISKVTKVPWTVVEAPMSPGGLSGQSGGGGAIGGGGALQQSTLQQAVGAGFTGQQGSEVPVLTMSDATMYINENFDIAGTITGNPTSVFVEGLLRGWWYEYANGTLNIKGNAIDTALQGAGIWKVLMQYNSITVTGSTTERTLSHDSTLQAAAEDGNSSTAINFGTGFGSGPGIGAFTWQVGIVYATLVADNINAIRIRINCNRETAGRIECRYSTTQPSSSDGSELSTHGTRLFRPRSRGSNNTITGDGTITGITGQIYFWFIAPDVTDPDTIDITNRRLRTDATSVTTTTTTTTEVKTEEDEVSWRIIKYAPVITNPGTVAFYKEDMANLPIAISNDADGVRVDGLLVGMKYETTRGEEGISTGIAIRGTPSRVVAASENREITVHATTSGGEDTEKFKFTVIDTSAPSMSMVTATPDNNLRIKFTWTAVAGAKSYSYKIGFGVNDPWIDVGNVTEFTLSDLAAGTYTFLWRIETPWISDEVRVTATARGVPLPPAAPTLSATKDSSGKLTLTWTTPNDRGSTITEFQVENKRRATDTNPNLRTNFNDALRDISPTLNSITSGEAEDEENWNRIWTVPTPNWDESRIVTFRHPNPSYFLERLYVAPADEVWVRAINDLGNGAWSNTITYNSATTVSGQQGAPSASVPAAPVLSHQGLSTGRIFHLQWTTPADNGADITHYELDPGDGGDIINLGKVNLLPTYIDFANTGTELEIRQARDVSISSMFKVRAVNSVGASAWSNAVVRPTDVAPNFAAPLFATSHIYNSLAGKHTIPIDFSFNMSDPKPAYFQVNLANYNSQNAAAYDLYTERVSYKDYNFYHVAAGAGIDGTRVSVPGATLTIDATAFNAAGTDTQSYELRWRA